MGGDYLFMTIWIIGVTLAVSIALIRKGIHSRALSIFLGLFLTGQLIGYGLNVDILKAIIPHGKMGTAYQVIPSTVIPLALAFIINYVYGLFKR